MSRMFGQRINEFVLSADIMDHDTFTDLLKLVHAYVNRQLDITYLSVLEETVVNDQPGLRTEWTTREDYPAYSVDKAAGYSSHSAYAFGENKPIWVVSESRGPLQGATDARDRWSGASDLPRYAASSKVPVRTSVMHPLRKEGRAIGIVEFAAKNYMEPTPASLEEASTLATVISRAYLMYDVRRAQREATSRAMKMLEDSLQNESWRRLALPQLFVAYPGVERLEGAAREDHEALVATIRSVVDEFVHTIKPIYWSDVTEAGNINQQVLRDIGESEFGLCYFSEPCAGGGYQDNPNVLFEAGMMQALTNAPNALLRAWIPVREKGSAAMPFDIASERILRVDRTDGALDKAAFADGLRRRLTSLVEELRREEAQ